MRRPAAAVKPRTSRMTSFAAPTGGWIANRNLAAPNISNGQQGAVVLDNWFPTAQGAVLRRGSVLYATLGDGSLPVASMFAYKNGGEEKLFASTQDTIYDISTILTSFNYALADDNGFLLSTDEGDTFGESSTADNAVLTGQLGGNWSVVQFASQGGVFLRGVNGQDPSFVYDGTTWGATPAITFADGETTTDADFRFTFASQNRIWFLKKASLDAYYLPVNSIGGEAALFPMGGIFNRGGSLLFGSTWSLESGDGVSAKTVFVTTEGEVAVYAGSDPSDATYWSLEGVYRIGKPLGQLGFIHAGGDIVIATDIGFIPLSQAIQRDYAALSPSAVSYPIETAWNDAVSARSSSPWICEVWPSGQMVVVALPTVTNSSPEVYVANARTGAWARFTGWDISAIELYQDRMLFGTPDGTIVEANASGLDQNSTFTAAYVPLFDDLRSPGSLKVAELARATMRSPVSVKEKVAALFDFSAELPTPPDATLVMDTSSWGTAIWGASTWGTASAPITQGNWQSVGGAGYAAAICLQVTSGSLVPLDSEIVRIDLTYATGDLVS